MQAEMFVTARNKGGETHFEGEVTIAQKTFSYKLTFQVPLLEYMAAAQGRTMAQMRQLVHISIAHEGREIDLTDREWTIFYYAVGAEAVKIYNMRHLAGEKWGANNHVITVGTGTVILQPEACKLLAQPKFGCQFLDHSTDPCKKPS